MAVRNNTRNHRYELEIDGSLAKAWYRENGDVITFTHTEVPEALSGRGVGSQPPRAPSMQSAPLDRRSWRSAVHRRLYQAPR